MSRKPVPFLRGGQSTVYELIRFLFLPSPYLVTQSVRWQSLPRVHMAVYHHRTNLSLPPSTPPVPTLALTRLSLDTKRCLHDWARPSSEQNRLCQFADESSVVLPLLVESHPYYYSYLPAVRDRKRFHGFADLACRHSFNPTRFTPSCSRWPSVSTFARPWYKLPVLI